MFDELAFEQSLDDAVNGDAADLFGFCPGKGLAVGNDGEGFEGGLGEFWRPGFLPDEGADPRGVLASGDELPGASDADEAVAPAELFVFFGQLFQFLVDAFGAWFGEGSGFAGFLGRFCVFAAGGFPVFCGGAAEVANFGRGEWFLGGEEERLYGEA